MFKKLICFAFLSLSIFLSERVVLAVTNTPEIATPSPTIISLVAQTSVKTIVAGITDYLDRLTSINKKIGTRIDKLRKAKVKTTVLSTKYNNLNRQLQLLKVEVGKAQNISAGFLVSSNPQEDYLLLKKQLLITQNALRSTLANENEIIADLTKYSSISAAPSAVIKK